MTAADPACSRAGCGHRASSHGRYLAACLKCSDCGLNEDAVHAAESAKSAGWSR